MTSTPSTSNTSAKFKGSKIPTLKDNVLNLKQNTSTRMTKIPLEKGKSAGELKQRLASAVSAKIAAANKEGRTTNNNRGIGYLLQRKQQQDSKLNTKTIMLQKPLRNSNGEDIKGDRSEAKNGSDKKDGANGLSQPSARKSLLSALMSSRMPSGALQGRQSSTEAKIDMSDPARKTTAGERTMRSEDKSSSLGKPFPDEKAAKDGDSGSRNSLNLRQENEKDKSFAGIRRVPSQRSTVDKTSLNLNSENISLSNPSDNVNSNVAGTNRVKDKNPLLEKGALAQKHHILGTNENEKNIQRNPKPRVAPKPTAASKDKPPLRKVTSGKNSATSSKHDKFREDLLEKLEADIGSCKIAAFQNMEDFSILRMRVYRIRGDLEQLKKERAKRTLV